MKARLICRHVLRVTGATLALPLIGRAAEKLPPGADFAVVHLVATKWTPRGKAAEFGEQFADDVRLTLKTQPTLPVRLAQR